MSVDDRDRDRSVRSEATGERTARPKRRGSRPIGDTIGGILVGFDQQIMRNQPPPHELVQKGAPVRGLAGDDVGDLTITLAGTSPEVAATTPARTAASPERGAIDTPATTDALDDEPDAWDVFTAGLRSFGAHRRFAGRARTVRCRDDNALVRSVLETPGEGGVLVVDGAGSRTTALLGEVVATLAVDHGWAAIVVHGCVRDTAALARLPIGILALAACPRRSGKAGAGDVDVAVRFGEATFRPGTLVVADEDGLIVRRREDG